MLAMSTAPRTPPPPAEPGDSTAPRTPPPPAEPGDVLDRLVLRVEAGKVCELAMSLGTELTSASDIPPVPLTFPVTATFTGRQPLEMLEILNMDPDRSLHGEQEFIYHRPLTVGMELIGETRLIGRDVRHGSRGGRIKRVIHKTVFRDQSGKPVVTAVHTILETSTTLRSQA